MKNLIKKMIPRRIMPVMQRLYGKLGNPAPEADSEPQDFSEVQLEGLTALKCTISYNKYGGYCVPNSSCHRPAAQDILTNRVYESKTIEFILSKCGKGDVVQAGAYFGDFLPALSQGIAPGCKVWAFEPNPENYRCARITLELNAIENVVLTNAGLGAKPDCLFMRTVDRNGRSLGGASRVIGKETNEATAVKIQMVTIDDIVESDRAVSIIQLDVEGYEKEALTGALKTIQRSLPVIILEVFPNNKLFNSSWFSENILNLGYRQIDQIYDNSVFACER